LGLRWQWRICRFTDLLIAGLLIAGLLIAGLRICEFADGIIPNFLLPQMSQKFILFGCKGELSVRRKILFGLRPVCRSIGGTPLAWGNDGNAKPNRLHEKNPIIEPVIPNLFQNLSKRVWKGLDVDR